MARLFPSVRKVVVVAGGGNHAGTWGPDFGDGPGDGSSFESAVDLDMPAAYVTGEDTINTEAIPAVRVIGDDQNIGTTLTGTVIGTPQLVAIETNEGAPGLGGGSLSVNVPTHIAGDLLVCIVAGRADANHTADQAGWTVAHQTNEANAYVTIFTRIAGASEPASYSFTVPDVVTVDPTTCLDMLSIRGADPTTPVDTVASTGATNRTTSVACPNRTPTTAYSLLIAHALIHNALNATQDDYAYTPPANYDEQSDHQHAPTVIAATTPMVDVSSTSRLWAGLGATGGPSFTFTPQPLVGTTVNKVGTHLVIAHDPAGVPIP